MPNPGCTWAKCTKSKPNPGTAPVKSGKEFTGPKADNVDPVNAARGAAGRVVKVRRPEVTVPTARPGATPTERPTDPAYAARGALITACPPPAAPAPRTCA